MRPARVIAAFAVAVFLGGALLGPWLYELAQWGAGQAAGLRFLADHPFHRYVHRAMLGLALLGIWPLMRALGSASWGRLGWVRPQGQWGRLALGFGIGFVSLALVIGVGLAVEARFVRTDLSAGRLLSRVVSAALSAGVVALLEETFFRGALLGSLQRAYGPAFGLWASSAIYALVHFFQRPPSPESVQWYSGLVVLGQMLHGFVEVRALVPGLFTLLLAGIILGLAFQRTGSLYLSVGVHAGWIFWLKCGGYTTALRPSADQWLWGSAKLIDGWICLGLLAGVLLLLVSPWCSAVWTKHPEPGARGSLPRPGGGAGAA